MGGEVKDSGSILTLLVLFHAQQGVEDVKQHKWFKAVDWDAVLQRKLVVSGEECGFLARALVWLIAAPFGCGEFR